MSFELTKDEIKIATIQKALKGLGWQWREYVFNDKSHEDCMIDLTLATTPNWNPHSEDSLGWGRFSRIDCWVMAYKYITGIDWESQ